MLYKQCIQQPDKIILLLSWALVSSAMKPVKDYTTLNLKIQNKWLYAWEINHLFSEKPFINDKFICKYVSFKVSLSYNSLTC